MAPDDPAWIYENNQVRAMFEPWARVLIDVARPQRGESVLDAACGTGVVARKVVPLVGNTGRTVGFDFDPLMLAVAKSLGPDITWQQADLQRLPFADGEFDLVLCQQGLQFLPDRAAGLREMHRVLRPGGRMVMSIWTELAKSTGQAVLFGALGELLGKDMSSPPPWSLSDGRDVEALVAGAGFVDVNMTVMSLPAAYPSAEQFVEIHLEGASKLTRQVLAQIPADRRLAFIEKVTERLRRFESDTGLVVSNESRVIVGRKSGG